MALDLPRAVQSRLDPAERYGLRLSLMAVALVMVAIPFSYLTFQVLGAGSLTRLDARVANALNAWAHHRPVVLRALEVVSLLAKPVTLWVIGALAVGWLWRLGRNRTSVFLAVTSLGGGAIVTLVKAAVDRPRPVVDHPVATALGKSFPSGHTMGATVVFGALLVAFWPILAPRWRRWVLAATTVLVLAVGSSRLLLGVHFLTDVVGGFVLGIAWLSGSVAAFATWRHDRVVEAVVTDAPDCESRPTAGPLEGGAEGIGGDEVRSGRRSK